MKSLEDFCFRIWDIIFHTLPVSNRKVYFISYFGRQYSDNPKYISEKLHELAPDIKIYWEMQKSAEITHIPKYVRIVRSHSIKSCYYKNRCKVVVEWGIGYYNDNKTNKFIRWLKKKLILNKKQFDLSTWHGTPMKYIGAQIPGHENWTKETFFTTSNLLLSGSEYLSNIFHKAYFGVIPITMTGTPRTDILFNKSEKFRNKIKAKLGIPLDKKCILYAPTFRDSIYDSGIEQIKNIDIGVLLNVLSEKFGGSWVFVMRVHPLVQFEISTNNIVKNYGNLLINGNKYDDMMEYLFVADVLLTDYSSSIFDYALTDNPCFLYAHDRDSYFNKQRGVYESLSFFPYKFAESFNDLIVNIKSYDYDYAEKERLSFIKKIGCIEDGNASERGAKIVLDKLSYN